MGGPPRRGGSPIRLSTSGNVAAGPSEVDQMSILLQRPLWSIRWRAGANLERRGPGFDRTGQVGSSSLTDWRQMGSGVVDVTFGSVGPQVRLAGVPDQPCGQGVAGVDPVGSTSAAESGDPGLPRSAG